MYEMQIEDNFHVSVITFKGRFSNALFCIAYNIGNIGINVHATFLKSDCIN